MKCEWKEVKLGEVVITNKNSFTLSEQWSFVNYLDTGNITENKIDTIQYIDLKSKEKLPSRAKRKVEINDIIYSTVRPIQRHYGFLNKYIENLLVSTGFTTITTKPIVNSKFIYYFLTKDEIIQNLQSLAEQSVSTYPSIKSSDIENLIIQLPPLETQKKIASILSALDDKIELNNAINKNLEEQAQALFKSWFVDFEPFGGVMPNEMQYIPLQDLCEVITKGTTPTTLGKPFVDRGINFIKAESILDNHYIDKNKFAYIDDETNQMLKRSIIKLDDIVFTIAGTLGRFAIIDNNILPANTNQAVAIIRPNSNKINALYLYSFFVGNWHNEYYSKRIQQAVQANLSLTTIKSLPIAILNKNTMKKFSSLITPLFNTIKNNEKENQNLSTLRDTLLPKLMSGEIDVSEIDI